MVNINAIAGDVTAQVETYLLNRFTPFMQQLEHCRAVLRGLKQGEIKLEQVQIMEDGTIRILPSAPEMTCIEEVTKQVPEIKKNGADPKANTELAAVGSKDGTG